jgi:hypothetical protein
MPRVSRPENLIPINKRTKEEQREICSKGGKISGEKRREKKLQSQAYARAMAKKYKVVIGGEEQELDWEDFQSIIIRDIMIKRDSCSVSLMREMREGTEGNKLKIGDLNGDSIQFEFVEPPKRDESTE